MEEEQVRREGTQTLRGDIPPHFMDKEVEIWKREMIDLDHFSSYFHSVQCKYIL